MKFSLIALALAAALPLSAQASELSYTYVEADYASTKIDTDFGDTTFDGAALKGSFVVSKNFYISGGYSSVFGDEFGISEELNHAIVGLGFRHAISATTDWDSELSYVHETLTVDKSAMRDEGFQVATGMRFLFGDKFEANFNVNYVDVGDFGDGFGADVGGQFHFNDTWGITAGYDYSDRDISGTSVTFGTWTVGARASF